LAVSRIVASAPIAVDQESVDPADVGMHTHGPAASAAVIHRVSSGDEAGLREYSTATVGNFSKVRISRFRSSVWETLGADGTMICAVMLTIKAGNI
jgi:hypothetical protein